MGGGNLNRKILVAFVAMMILTIVSVGYATVLVSRTVNMTANIVAVGSISLFSDSACTVPLTTIDWGNSQVQGSYIDKDIFVKETSGVDVWVSWALTGLTQIQNYYTDNGGGITGTGNVGIQFNSGDDTMFCGTVHPLVANGVFDIPIRLLVGTNGVHSDTGYSFSMTITAYDNSAGT